MPVLSSDWNVTSSNLQPISLLGSKMVTVRFITSWFLATSLMRCSFCESYMTWLIQLPLWLAIISTFPLWKNQFSAVQSLTCVWLFVTPWTAAPQASLSITNFRSPHKPMSIESMMPSNHLILCHPLLLLPSVFPSVRVFSNESALRIRWPKYWSFSFNIRPSNEYPGLISFRIDWLDLLAIQGTLKILLQHHSSKASVLRCSAFFIFQLSRPYMAIGKTIALTRQNFVGKVISLLLNMLSRLVITFLPRSKHLLILWLQSPSVVSLEPRKIKSATVSPSICHEVEESYSLISGNQFSTKGRHIE